VASSLLFVMPNSTLPALCHDNAAEFLRRHIDAREVLAVQCAFAGHSRSKLLHEAI
jgi:hypothetical protein